MRIQSKFKDYYDFISHKFGQDPDIVYVREPLKKTEIEWECRDYFEDTIKRRDRKGRTWQDVNKNLAFRFLVVGERVVAFIFDSDTGRYERLTEAHASVMQENWSHKGSKYPMLPTGEDLANLICCVGAPVFLIHHIFRGGARKKGVLYLEERIPVLADMGFPTFMKPEVIWQEIYATMTNVLRKNPDKEPPVTVANEYKIHAAGFDLKTSFRHPVNQKKSKK